MPKYLVEQNKSSTFAIAFEKQGVVTRVAKWGRL